MFRSGRKLAVLLAAAATVAVSLALVGIVRAGSSSGTTTAFEAPINLTTGQQGLAWAKFSPVIDPLSNSNGNGAATHVVIDIKIPEAVGGSLTVTGCAGKAAYPTAKEATCALSSSVPFGSTVAMFVTFVAGSASTYPADASVTAQTSFDNGNGSSGTTQSSAPNTTGYKIYAADGTNIFAGRCSNTKIDLAHALFADDSAITGKTGKLTTPTTVGSSIFPCTPAFVGVDESAQVPTGFTPGTWNVQLEPLSNNQLASVTITSATVRDGFKASNVPLYEIRPNGLHQVQPCNGTQLPASTDPPTPEDSCIVSQGKFGGKGVQFSLLVAGTKTDPSYTG